MVVAELTTGLHLGYTKLSKENVMQHVQITKWGNSLGFRIPRGIAASLDIQAGDTLELAPAEGGLLLKKALRKGKRYALVDILDSFTPSSAHPEIDFGKPQGEEVW
jgi:antitoxin MazE